VTLLALSVLLVACQNAAAPVVTPSPRPSPHTTAIAAVLQSSEVPAGLNACPGSGPIGPYLLNLQAADPALATRVTAEWQQLQAEGAVDAAISLFAADPSACTAELGVNAATKAAAAFVAVFADEGQAERAWESGIFGFLPPAPTQLTPGLLRGTGTGLGLSSWTLNRPPIRLACWHRSVFVALVVLGNLDPTAFHAATVAIDARLN
jgi:hypothetical protein